jgi:hypothetical protein
MDISVIFKYRPNLKKKALNIDENEDLRSEYKFLTPDTLKTASTVLLNGLRFPKKYSFFVEGWLAGFSRLSWPH